MRRVVLLLLVLATGAVGRGVAVWAFDHWGPILGLVSGLFLIVVYFRATRQFVDWPTGESPRREVVR